MYNSQLLFYDNEVLSPWMERRGNTIMVTADLVAHINAAKLDVQLYHKNYNETGPGALVNATSLQTTGLGRHNRGWTNLKELVRYKVKCTVATSPNAYDYVMQRLLSPVWMDGVKA